MVRRREKENRELICTTDNPFPSTAMFFTRHGCFLFQGQKMKLAFSCFLTPLSI
ncbi:hypothetical protein ADINL_2207 [Nitrincola lacisaponensis]|uniref:Uncharacterized protein n=1 Tax=Nitrincola lacisaponensis TaxID=267850 RepID=A0A063XY62_9GAMM|nr:hypothetical protein ADINL_2207 [Nitrincola lacisaponensis]